MLCAKTKDGTIKTFETNAERAEWVQANHGVNVPGKPAKRMMLETLDDCGILEKCGYRTVAEAMRCVSLRDVTDAYMALMEVL